MSKLQNQSEGDRRNLSALLSADARFSGTTQGCASLSRKAGTPLKSGTPNPHVVQSLYLRLSISTHFKIHVLKAMFSQCLTSYLLSPTFPLSPHIQPVLLTGLNCSFTPTFTAKALVQSCSHHLLPGPLHALCSPAYNHILDPSPTQPHSPRRTVGLLCASGPALFSPTF